MLFSELQIEGVRIDEAVIPLLDGVLHLVGVPEGGQGRLVNFLQSRGLGFHVARSAGVYLAGFRQFGAQVGHIGLLDHAGPCAHFPLLQHTAGVGDGAVQLELGRDALFGDRVELPLSVASGVGGILGVEEIVTHVERIEVVRPGDAVAVGGHVLCEHALVGRAAHGYLAPGGSSDSVALDGGEHVGGVACDGALAAVLQVVAAVPARGDLPDELVEELGLLSRSGVHVRILDGSVAEPVDLGIPEVVAYVDAHRVIRVSAGQRAGSGILAGSVFVEEGGEFRPPVAIVGEVVPHVHIPFQRDHVLLHLGDGVLDRIHHGVVLVVRRAVGQHLVRCVQHFLIGGHRHLGADLAGVLSNLVAKTQGVGHRALELQPCLLLLGHLDLLQIEGGADSVGVGVQLDKGAPSDTPAPQGRGGADEEQGVRAYEMVHIVALRYSLVNTSLININGDVLTVQKSCPGIRGLCF